VISTLLAEICYEIVVSCHVRFLTLHRLAARPVGIAVTYIAGGKRRRLRTLASSEAHGVR